MTMSFQPKDITMRNILSALTLALALPALPAAAQDFQFFRAPSGNIHCMITTWDGGSARCDIREYTPSFPNRPGWCEQDYGFAFEVASAGSGMVVCAGDTVADPGAPVLPYGQTVSTGHITCTSQSSGMSCLNRAGHGFTVARAAQRVF